MDALNTTILTLKNVTIGNDPQSATSTAIGFILLVIYILGSGSCLVPVKKVETGDGMFFQLIFSLSLWSVGLIVNLARDSPKFYWLSMLGGFLFTFGNIMSVPMIKCIGLALSLLIRCVLMLATSWAGARFGFFYKAQVPKIIWMNYLGVILAVLSIVAFVFVRPDIGNLLKINSENSDNKLKNTSFFDRLSPNMKHTVGISLAIASGILYGFDFFPTFYIMVSIDGASKSGSDYTFSYFSGILLSSVFCFGIYCMLKKNKPTLYPKATLPTIVGGIIWGIANWSLLEANGRLSQSVTFPIGSSGQPMIATLYGVFLFKEVKGKWNLFALGVGVALTVAGAVVTGLSN